MGKNLWILSAINSLCCLLLITYQVPQFLEATDYVSIYRRKQYVIETAKLIAYFMGLFSYVSLGCYKSCFDCIHNNFALKFSGISIILSVFVLYDGVTRLIYPYIAYSGINLLCTVLIYKEIVREWIAERRQDEYIDTNNDKYEKIKAVEEHYTVDISEAMKRKEGEIV